MSVLFTNNAGKVGVVSGGLPAIVTVDGFRPTAVIITNIGVGQQANVQIQPSLKQTIYVYAFGDSMGIVRLGGMAFIAEICAGGRRPKSDGVAEIVKFYAANRVSRRLKHVNVTIGATVFSGFLMNMNAQTQDAEKRFFSWSMEIAALPNFDGLASDADAAAADTQPSAGASSGTESMRPVLDLSTAPDRSVSSDTPGTFGPASGNTVSNGSGLAIAPVE